MMKELQEDYIRIISGFYRDYMRFIWGLYRDHIGVI